MATKKSPAAEPVTEAAPVEAVTEAPATDGGLFSNFARVVAKQPKPVVAPSEPSASTFTVAAPITLSGVRRIIVAPAAPAKVAAKPIADILK